MAKLEEDPTWLNIYLPQKGGPEKGWRQSLVAKSDQLQHQRQLTQLAASVVPRLRKNRDSLSSDTIAAMKLIHSKVQQRSSGRGGSAAQSSRGAGQPCVVDSARPNEDEPPSSWRRYRTARGATARVAERARELGRTVHNAAEGDNKIFPTGTRPTGTTESRSHFQGSQLPPQMQTTQPRDSLDTWQDASHTSADTRGQERSRSALGLYDNYEREPLPSPAPLERIQSDVGARCSMYDASYKNWHPSKEPSLEARAYTHPNVQFNFNYGTRPRPSAEGMGEYKRYSVVE